MTNYKQQEIKALANRIKAAGYRVFIAKRGTYGFYTDPEGSRVITFAVEYFEPSFSGNYTTDKPRETGTGWRISNKDSGDYKAIFESSPPQWAVKGSKYHLTTLSEHLKAYDASSHYNEVT